MGKLTFIVGALAVLRLVGHFTDPVLSSAQIHRVVGDPARTTAVFEPTVRVVTWNIEQGVRFDAIAHELKRMNADIVLLQEADINCRRSGNRNVPRDLAQTLGMNWIAAGEFQEIGESSHDVPALTTQAILSRFPISESSVVRFNNQSLLRWKLSPVQPRRGARIALKAETGGIQIYNAHIESGGGEKLRTRQVRQMLDDFTRGRQTGRSPGLTIIAGDFNNVPSSQSPMFPMLEEGGFDSAIPRSTPHRTSVNNKHPIDWIYSRGFESTAQVIDTGDASDHFPIVAELTATASRRDARERSPHTETTRTP